MQPKGWGENWNNWVCARNIHLWSAISVFFSPWRWDFLVFLADGQWQHFPCWLRLSRYPVRVFRCSTFPALLFTFVWFYSPLMSVVLSKNGWRFSGYMLLFRYCWPQLFVLSVWKRGLKGSSSVLTIDTKMVRKGKLIFPLHTVKEGTVLWDLIFWVRLIKLIGSCYLCYCFKWNSTQLSQHVCAFNLK